MKVPYRCRTGFDSNSLTAAEIAARLSLSLEFAIEIIPIIPYIGVVFSFMGSLSFYFLMILKEKLTFSLLANLVIE